MAPIAAFTPAHELARRIRTREISPTEVVEFFLERSLRLDPHLNALATIAQDDAKRRAEAAERALARREEVGPLHGVPFVVKDLEWTKGIRTTMGSLIYRDFVPTDNSIAVEGLTRAGAIVLGKGNACEFGMQLETTNRLGPDTRNPWDPTRSSGGSSGGSAVAVATGFVPLATGSDSAGSIGNPSALCGVVGLKPTHGRVPLWPDPGDSHLLLDTGCQTRSVQDRALMLSIMAGEDSRDPASLRGPVPDFLSAASRPPGVLRVAWSTTFSRYPVEREIRDVVESAALLFGSMGHHLSEAEPCIDGHFLDTYMPLYLGDVHVAYDDLLSQRASDLDPLTRSSLGDARLVTLSQYVQALHRLVAIHRRVEEFFDDHDLLITPATPVCAFPALNPPDSIDGQPVPRDWTPHLSFLTPWNLAGNPSITVPAGLSEDGLPVGILLVAGAGREDLLLAAAAAFEQERPWAEQIPPLALDDTIAG